MGCYAKPWFLCIYLVKPQSFSPGMYYMYLNVRINVDALTLLPEDGNLNGLHSITLDLTIDDPGRYLHRTTPYDAHLSASFVTTVDD